MALREQIKIKEKNKRGQNIEKIYPSPLVLSTDGKNNRKLIEWGGKSYLAPMRELVRPVPIPHLERGILVQIANRRTPFTV